MLLTKGLKCAFIPVTNAYVEFMGKEKYEGIHCIAFIAKSNTWIKGATSHKPRPRECMCGICGIYSFHGILFSCWRHGYLSFPSFFWHVKHKYFSSFSLSFFIFRDSHAPFWEIFQWGINFCHGVNIWSGKHVIAYSQFKSSKYIGGCLCSRSWEYDKFLN